ncbi:MAG: toxin-antitoxin system HicB family antitoxin [Xenococcaceae cyanobacterium]
MHSKCYILKKNSSLYPLPELHQKISLLATKQNVSLNTFVEQALEKVV